MLHYAAMRRFAFVFATLALACSKPPSSEQNPGPTQPTATTPVAAPKAPAKRPAPPAATAGAQVGAPIPAFTADILPVAGGAPTKVDSAALSKPTAFVMLGTGCPATGAYAGRLVDLEKQYGGKVDFVFVYPNATDPVDAKTSFHREKSFARGFVDDQGGRIARTLGARRTSEVFLTDAKGTLVYHGAIDDNRDATRVTRKHLAMAIDETLAGQAVTTPKTDVHA